MSRNNKKFRYIKCNLCQKNYPELFLRGRDFMLKKKKVFNIVRCRNCGLVYINPQPKKKELKKFYPKQYTPFLPHKNKMAELLKNFLIKREITRFKKVLKRDAKKS